MYDAIKLKLIVIVFSFAMCILGCSNKKTDDILEERVYQYKEISPADSNVLSVVRAVVISSANLTDEEKNLIKNEPPICSTYYISDSFGQFYWDWNLNPQKRIHIQLVGDLEAIDPNKITITFKSR